MKTRSWILIIIVAIIGIGATDAFFTVHQTKQVIVLQFGKTKAVYSEPGLKFKLPFIQDIIKLDRRVLDLSAAFPQVTLFDQKRIEVGAYARYKIVDPLQFYRSVTNERRAQQRLTDEFRASLQRVMGKVTLTDILSDKRIDIMKNIKDQFVVSGKRFGIDVIDVRIIRADLPEQTSLSIFNRMKSERDREAREFRAQGAEQAQQIRSRADREKVVILAEAQQQADKSRGEGDAEAINTYAAAYNQGPDFYAFYRSLEAYKEALGDGGTTMVLSPSSDFFKYFNKKSG
jgi:modulator of FtsH protease HflC